MPAPAISLRAWAELFLLGLIWGATFLATSVILREVGVYTSVAFRVTGGAAVLWAFVLLRGYALPDSLRQWSALAVMGLLNNVLPFTLITWGQLRIESGLAAILNASTAVFGVLVAAALFADQRLTAPRLAGVLLGFGGVVTAIGWSALTTFDPTSLAQLAVVGAALSYAFAGAWARARLRGVPPQVSAAGMTGFSALAMVPLALAIDGMPDLAYAPSTWGAIGYLSIVGTALAYLLYYRVLDMAGPGNLLLVTLLLPPVAIILGALVLGEVLAPRALIGLAMLALGLILIDGRLFRRNRRQRAA